MNKRGYRQKRRKESTEETRRRIVDAVVELHATVGPARASIQAIARRAGVQRLTVYRHLPDETAVFQACSARCFEQNPFPDSGAWQHLTDAGDRTRTALSALYAFYRRTQGIWRNAYRDAHGIAALRATLAEAQKVMDGVRDDLLKAWRPARAVRREMVAVLSHAVHFSCWDALQAGGLSDPEIAEVVEKWLSAL